MSNHRLRIENLELRQLMAGDGIDCHMDGSTVVEPTLITVTDEFAVPNASLPFYWYPNATLIERSGSTVVVVSNSEQGKQILWGIREGGEAGAEISFQIDLGNLRVEKLMVDGDRLLVIGENGFPFAWSAMEPSAGNAMDRIPNGFAPYQEKRLLAVSLSTGQVVKELSLASGSVKHAQLVDGNALLVIDSYHLIYPSFALPVDASFNTDLNDHVYRFRWNADGLSEVTKDAIPSGQLVVAGDRLVVAMSKYSTDVNWLGDPSSIELESFSITAKGIVSDGRVELGDGFVSFLTVDSTGERASLIRQPNVRNEQPSAQLVLLDLTNKGPTLRETIELSGPIQVLSHADDYLLLQDYASGTLSLVNLSDDATGNTKIRKILLPESMLVIPNVIQLDSNRLLVLGGKGLRPIPLDTRPIEHSSRSTLVTLSLVDGSFRQQELSDVSSATNLQLIDSDEGRIGFETHTNTDNGTFSRAFVFGTLNEDGVFVSDGNVDAANWFESFHADATKLAVLSPNRVTVYDYADTTEPLYSLRLVDPNSPPLDALDDAVEFYLVEGANSVDVENYAQTIDVLANDQIPFGARWETRITELIGAPEGVAIVDGKYISLSSAQRFDVGKVVFSYRVTDGVSESEAKVELTIKAITDELREQMLSSVKARAAQDLNVPAEQIEVKFDSDFTLDRLPVPLIAAADANADGSALGRLNLTQSPRFRVRVAAPGFNALYYVDVAGNAYQVWSEQVQREPMVAFTFVITDEAAIPIEKVEAGQTFWLEFRGDDLRALGSGLFSAFLNLVLVSTSSADGTRAASFDGTAEAGPGMTFIDGENISEKISTHSIRGLGVVSSSTDAPGGASQQLLRVRATANGAGTITLKSFASQNASEETVLFGSNSAVSENQIRRESASLEIVEKIDESDPADVDLDGKVRALDALRVINFMSRHGVGTLEQIESRIRDTANGTATPVATLDLARFDVNRNGSITALDALIVINRMSRLQRLEKVNAGVEKLPSENQQLATVDVSMASDPAIDELEQKRRRK